MITVNGHVLAAEIYKPLISRKDIDVNEHERLSIIIHRHILK